MTRWLLLTLLPISLHTLTGCADKGGDTGPSGGDGTTDVTDDTGPTGTPGTPGTTDDTGPTGTPGTTDDTGPTGTPGTTDDTGTEPENDPPSAEFLSPTVGEAFVTGDVVEIRLEVSDDNDDPDDIELIWTGDAKGFSPPSSPDSSGVASFYMTGLSDGTFTVYVSATDTHGDTSNAQVYFVVAADNDGDGFVSTASGGDDCDDTDASINPDAIEICDGVDNDCSGLADDDAVDTSLWYVDIDSDSYGDPDISQEACDAPANYVDNNFDCDDSEETINPAADEVCNGLDDDCDDTVDDNPTDPDTFYADDDEDGFGDASDSVEACDAPDGYTADATDCDDSNADANPDATEICDGVDNDCNDAIDDGASDTSTFYADNDEDGFGDSDDNVAACEAPDGYTNNTGDCDDTDGDINPTADEICDEIDNNCDGDIDGGASDAGVWYTDSDSDGYGGEDSVTACDAPLNTVDIDGDCDDSDGDVNPDAIETCNSIDDDCNGLTDDDASGAQTWYDDDDSDGYGDPDRPLVSCDEPVGYSDNDSDCDDDNGDINPEGTESCDGADEDCDSTIDEGAADLSTFYADSDADGYGDADTSLEACSAPVDYVDNLLDCDDTDGDVNPDADEICNSVDDDCSGLADDDVIDGVTYYEDSDNDGYGYIFSATVTSCSQPDGYVTDDTDCDDTDSSIYPGGEELCDSLDNDCDSATDEVEPVWYRDADEDGHGNADVTDIGCDQPDGYVSLSDDCNDGDPDINPDADEVCDDEVDNDCNGETDDDASVDAVTYFADTDEDGYGDPDTTVTTCTQPEGYLLDNTDCADDDGEVYPGALEICNGLDDNCDGLSEVGLEVPGDYTSLAAAISAADSGDTICVAGGDYTGPVDFGGKDIVLQGAGSDVTSIDVNGGRVNFSSGETAEARIMGFTIWGADDDYGGAMNITSSSPTVQDIVFEENDCSSFTTCQGAVLYLSNSSSEFTDVVFQDNVIGPPSSSGAFYVNGGLIYASSFNGSFDGLTFHENEIGAQGTLGNIHRINGGMMYLYNSSPDITDLTITDNWLDISYGTNSSNVYGGLIYYSSLSDPWIENSYINGNILIAGESDYIYGGFFYQNNSSPQMYGLEFSENILSTGFTSINGGVSFTYSSASPSFDVAEFLDNEIVTTGSVRGGLFWYERSSYPSLTNAIIAGNDISSTSTYGGIAHGDYYSTGSYTTILSMTNVDIVGNIMNSDTGATVGGIFSVYTYSSSSSSSRQSYSTGVDLLNTNVAFNDISGSAVYGSILYDSNGTYDSGLCDFDYSNFFDNPGATEWYNYATPVGASGNRSDDPLYTDISTTDAIYWDLTLQSTSPVRNAGDPSILDPDFTYSAIGAYGGPGAADW